MGGSATAQSASGSLLGIRPLNPTSDCHFGIETNCALTLAVHATVRSF